MNIKSDQKSQFFFICLITICMVLGWIFYGTYGHQLVSAVYESRVPGFFKNVIHGSAVNPVGFYYEKADHFMGFISVVLSLILASLISRFFKKTKLAVFFLLLIPAVCYVSFMADSLVGEDGDEYLLQAYQSGIAHPCGYPVYLWLGKAFLVIFNNSLNSLSILSVVFSILTIVFLYWFMRRLKVSQMAAAYASLLFALTPIFWKNAITPRAQNINSFFLILILFLIYVWSKKRDVRILLFMGFLYGLSLGIHFSNILMLVPILLFLTYEYVLKNKSSAMPIVFFIASAVLGMMGPLIYIYVRSTVMPPIGTLYNPDDLKDLFFYLSGAQFKAFSFGGWKYLLDRITSHAVLLFCSFAGLGLFFALTGVSEYCKKEKAWAFFLVSLFIVNFVYFTNYSAADYQIMPTLSYLVLAIFIGVGLEHIFSKKGGVWSSIAIICTILVILQTTAFPIFYNIRKQDDYLLRVCKRDLGLLSKNAVLFAEWRAFTSLLCVQAILKERPDVDIYEVSEQPRNYIKNGRMVSFVWRDYIDKNIAENRPIYSACLDSYINSKYHITPIHHRLFLLELKAPSKKL